MSRTGTADRTPLLAALFAFVATLYDFAASFVKARTEVARKRHNQSLAHSNRGQMQDLAGVIIMLGVAIVAAFAVLYLANEVIGIMNLSEGDPLYPAYESLVSATESLFGMYGFLFMIVVIAVGLAWLMRLR